ncbi:conserved hypothetical protein [Leishmania major strain Friedlin]|uniref:Uncharacterized protein n=1 Tax=Leishmania major TaxID=5664 RepID=Q4QBP7_LEIMA|nr:conserved hypothetical protein [Leishmania major strain Friedlin]CAG9573966.1 hypothetical_protein_-_conserved [Leishmania major strain Friedlin]CAJ04429.1 conserved hypothetical protein [Leishmania major strain Friedlin]|eukprot:XP_001683251.1 conserved hypothetical protein [Leishmania major strain Friedlin]
MPSLQEYWQSGFRGLHIEECISNAFADFAPYAGADQQRIVVSRQTPAPGRPVARSSDAAAAAAVVGTPISPAWHVASSSSVIVEENGDFTVQMRDPHAGSLAFSTTGHMQMEAAVRVDMPVRSSTSGRTGTSTGAERAVAEVAALSALPPTRESVYEAIGQRRAGDSTETATNAAATTAAAVVMHPVAKPAPSYLRFTDFTRPLTMAASEATAHSTNTARTPAPWGQLELDMSLPNWSANRQSIGARAGPAALRVSRALSAATAAAARSPTNSTSLSEDEVAGTAGGDAGHRYQYTLDAAVCVPFGGSGADASRAARRMLDGKPVVVLPAAPWALTCGMQLPLTLGDTLVGISLQNDRASSVTTPLPGVEWVVTAPAAPPSDASTLPGDLLVSAADEAHCTACVPSLLYPSHSISSGGSGDAASPSSAAATPAYVAIPSITVRLLLVQTLASHTLVRRDASDLSASQLDMSGSGYGAGTNGSRIASSYDWRQLPTLVGVNVGFDRDRLRMSAASILHNGEVDLEAAAVLDVTPWMPRMPTLLKVGYNNAGRLAAGITSLFYETVTATLGMHMARGEQARFGIEVSF